MSRNLSEDDIRIIDNRGRYSIRKGVVWGAVAIVLLLGIFFGAKLSRQARFISELTSGKAVSSQQVDTKVIDKIHVVEVNGAKVDITVSQWNLRLLNWAVVLIPDKYSKDPHKDLLITYKAFKRRVGIQHQKVVDFGTIQINVEYQNGNAYKYSFTNSLNDYSMTILCSYNELVKILDKVIE